MKSENCIGKNGVESSDVIESIESMSNILVTTISLLDQYKSDNLKQMKCIVDQLEQNDISYTYSIDQKLVIKNNGVGPESNARVQNHLDEKELQKTYNEIVKKNLEIVQNKHDLECTFLKKISNDCNSFIKETIEQAGIQILEAQEKERNRIARDLHDSVVQNLTNMVHKIEYCIRTMDSDIIGAKLDLQIMIQYVRDIINDIREIIYNLRPMTFDDLGIMVSIQRYIDVFMKSTNIDIKLKVDSDMENMNHPITNLTLLRIIQESCSNAYRHGGASKIQIQLSCKDDWIHLVIEDNGTGFDINKRKEQKRTDHSGFGLSIMKERVYLLSGHIQISSEIGKGTKITVKVPTENC